MTPTPDTAGPAPSAPKPYAPPSIDTLGTIESVTAGPSSRGNLDQLVGSAGGFQGADGTS